MHQHTPLVEVLRLLKQGARGVIDRYLQYKAHVCRQVYADPDVAAQRLPEREAAWPEYADSVELMSRPAYLSARATQPGTTFAECTAGRDADGNGEAKDVAEE